MSTVEPTKFVGKLDVATCQTVETIRLFFGQRDLVAVHTLAAAAHQVLVDVAHKRGVTSMLKGSADSSLSKDREHLRNINFPFNFFKHAKSDIDEHINIVPLDRFTQDCMMDNVLMLQKLSFSLRLEAKVY